MPEPLLKNPEYDAGWDRGWEAALDAAIEDALPSTAENPNEDAYQRGRFDGIMEYQRALRKLKE